MKRLYISGKITGTTDYMERFKEAEDKLSRDWDIINPAKVSSTLPELRHCQYMDICLVLLPMCDAIYMLKGWRDSEGALEEYREARHLGLEVLFEE